MSPNQFTFKIVWVKTFYTLLNTVELFAWARCMRWVKVCGNRVPIGKFLAEKWSNREMESGSERVEGTAANKYFKWVQVQKPKRLMMLKYVEKFPRKPKRILCSLLNCILYSTKYNANEVAFSSTNFSLSTLKMILDNVQRNNSAPHSSKSLE